MRKPLIILLALALVLFFALEIVEKVSETGTKLIKPAKPVEEPPVVKAEKPRFPDRVGEKIIYDVMMGKMRVGQAVFHYQSKSELEQKPVNIYTFETKMMNFRDNEKIYSDPETFLPLRVERLFSAWPKYEKITETYDQEKFTLDITKVESGREHKLNFKKDSVIHNAILLPYLVRPVPDLTVGWSFQANLPTQQFKIELAGIEETKVVAGTFKAYHFKSTPEKFEIWISADKYKIPLKIKGMSGIGYVLVMRQYLPGAGQ
jgi:hypothetical protein